jgi:hypothetical protein
MSAMKSACVWREFHWLVQRCPKESLAKVYARWLTHLDTMLYYYEEDKQEWLIAESCGSSAIVRRLISH